MISTINGIAGSDTLLDNADGAHDFIAADSYGITGFGLLRVTPDSLIYKEIITVGERVADEFTIQLERKAKVPRLRFEIEWFYGDDIDIDDVIYD